MVKDLIKNTIKNLKINKIKSLMIFINENPIVCFSDKYSIIRKRN